MTVYVDEILDWTLIAQARGLRHTHWCHLTADTEEELHAFAARLGLRRSWYQRKGPDDVGWHYDVTPNKRAQAVRLGAREVDHGFIARLMDHRRRERDGVPGGFVCGNDPNAVLTDGDRKAIEDVRSFLAQRKRPAAPVQQPAAEAHAVGWPRIKGNCPACRRASLFLGTGGYPTCSNHECPEPDAATTVLEQYANEAHPPEHRWCVETRDGVADQWAPGTRYSDRQQAVERREALDENHPLWKDGTPVERRLVRATTTYTVEEPAPEAQQPAAEVEPEPSDPTQCSGEEGFCPEHGFHRHSLKQPAAADDEETSRA